MQVHARGCMRQGLRNEMQLHATDVLLHISIMTANILQHVYSKPYCRIANDLAKSAVTWTRFTELNKDKLTLSANMSVMK